MGDAVVVIPARWASSRFPGKVLASLGGKALVLHACQLAHSSRSVGRVMVATDDPRVQRVVEDAGFEAVMTDTAHPSGTDRVAEVAHGLDTEWIVGLQADEPFLDPTDIDTLVEALRSDPRTDLATLAAPIRDRRQWLDPNVVKVVTDNDQRALYFSRSPIPYRRPATGSFPRPEQAELPDTCRVHLGVYGWRRRRLLDFATLPPSTLEISEGLEQLRALEAGWTLRVRPVAGQPFGIDTPEDLRRAEARCCRAPNGPQEN
ncbi:MAG: 3-deoxy-manno-octulosonate cytidylyltransferase [Acidobacteriota bacterium]|nr:3-deoxy-manno-octulosonate cytidylyltransferase [Acidobacteriota bacterium]